MPRRKTVVPSTEIGDASEPLNPSPTFAVLEEMDWERLTETRVCAGTVRYRGAAGTGGAELAVGADSRGRVATGGAGIAVGAGAVVGAAAGAGVEPGWGWVATGVPSGLVPGAGAELLLHPAISSAEARVNDAAAFLQLACITL